MGDLILDPVEGLAPRLTVCQWCGKDVGVILMGANAYETQCESCTLRLVGGGKCPKCGQYGIGKRKIPQSEKVPLGLCEECEKKKRQMATEVLRGGVYWQCTKCSAFGVIPAGDWLASETRRNLNVPTGPCGCVLTEKDCPRCSPEKWHGEPKRP